MTPFAAPTRMAPEESAAVDAAVRRVLASPTWIGGPEVEAFESEFAAYLDARADAAVVGVASGTDALVLALSALGVPRGSEVLVADDEGGYAAGAACQLGLRVRVMDLDPDLGVPTAATAAVAADHTTDLAVVVVTHLHGDAVPLADLDLWRRERGLLLVEDCAQAHGLRVDDTHVGLTGDAATFSFYPTKNLGAVGDAGALLVRGEPVDAARSLRQYGWGERYRVERSGGRNSRLDPIQAAVLRARLPYLDARNAKRREIADRYRRSIPLTGDPSTTVAHHAVALLPDRDARDDVAHRLQQAGVATAHHYPHLVSEMPALDASGGPTPVAAERRDRTLSLPCFPEMTAEEIEHVCGVLS